MDLFRPLNCRRLICVASLFALVSGSVHGQTLNGFDVSNATIPLRQIEQGGPPRDGIPSIDNPHFESAEAVNWLADDDRVLGISIDGDSRAYPLAIMNWHEIVNDIVADTPVAITFCPLCGTGMAFDARVDERSLNFGVSGLLYQSDVLLYDRNTESLWSQIMRQAVAGPYKGALLNMLPLAHTSWGHWVEQHPDTRVLTRDTGVPRDYDVDPYLGYADSPRLMFPVANEAPGPWHPKEWVLGVTIAGQHKAYPFSALDKLGVDRFQDELSGIDFEIRWHSESRSAEMFADDAVQPSLTAFWFAWYAFHPDTEVFTADQARRDPLR
jgi:hypothetical protein